MKKLIMAIVCFMTMISANAQVSKEKAISEAIKEARLNLKAPSTFILTDAYGYKIPTSKVSAVLLKEETETYTKQCGQYVHSIDSIDYLFTVDSTFVDSIVHTTYKCCKDSIAYVKRTYPAQYKVSFYYEAQNSLGGMVQNHAVFYVTRDCVHDCRFSYEKILKIEKNPDANINNNIKKTYSYLYGAKKATSNSGKFNLHKKHIENGELVTYYSFFGEYGNLKEVYDRSNSCDLCVHEVDEHYLYHSYKHLSKINSCRICKSISPEEFHNSKYHNELECLVCKKEHLTKHKKSKKGCEWCAQEK